MKRDVDIDNIIEGLDITIVQKLETLTWKKALQINKCGVYIFWTCFDEAYIGMTIHTGYRLYTHLPAWIRRSKKDFIDNVNIYLTEDIYIADILEKIMIGELQPELNSERDNIVYCNYKKDEFQQIKENIKNHTKKVEIENLRNERLEKEKQKEFEQRQKEFELDMIFWL